MDTAGPLLLETFFKHFLSHQKILKSSAARGEDIMYDEGEPWSRVPLLS